MHFLEIHHERYIVDLSQLLYAEKEFECSEFDFKIYSFSMATMIVINLFSNKYRATLAYF